ncbi:ParA family protein [Pseudonocardia adelaidensis]|uniref:ParA family protein n=1 Tax=Pseudonocardia adelaidensis TaxID=648754 RepID=A0ABP9NQJ6_9PSEU
MLNQAIAVINGKGGTGKTSITANLGGLFAAAGYRTLLVDMDPQGNLGRDLGYLETGRSDGGRALFNAVTTGTQLVPLREVRANLDVVAGGDLVEDMAAALYSRGTRGQSVATAIRDALAPLARDYDLILLDCPPGNRALQQMALATAHFVVIPTKADDASLDGLIQVANLFASVRTEINPGIELLGVVLFSIGARSRKIALRARSTVARDLGDPDLVFDTEIRLVEGPAQDCRRLGKLVHEVEEQLGHDRSLRFQMLRAARRSRKDEPRHAPGGALQGLAESAPQLAADYHRLAEELSGRLQLKSKVPA